MASMTSGKRIAAAERRSKAVALRIQGRTFAQIGTELRISAPRAYQLVRGALAMLTDNATEGAEHLRALEAMRLDELQVKVWEKAIGGDYKAVDRVLRIMERRAKLLGLDAPAKFAPTTPDGADPYAGLSEAEIDRRLAEKLAAFARQQSQH